MKNKVTIIIVLVLMVAALCGITGYYWYNNIHFVSTEDARVDGDIYKVSPQIAGEILEIKADEGDAVQAGQIIARMDDTALPNGGNTDLTLVKSPVSGLVIAKLAHVGEIGAAGQPVAWVIKPGELYITANIEENDLYKVKMDQMVDIVLDNQPGKKYTGEVDFIGEATLSTFSLLPQSNSSGNFTKVVQRIPVRIKFDNTSDLSRVLYGTNAVVKIHVK
ncbi:Biotin-lipoyl like [Desulfotomaculum arcticum]|uniref:Biotin-lipoyl like n=1 Tax=Desulfotruncus arcticus DSM 17038 TaxID=1121424 RepID=A0A1I2WZI5_9FIRM|nr:HlyD family efflux transporter periplasmic adaptor subunit [Desulfotruncus arcticus]SFH06685.1 Biotin-lipoyl like [Desulfotomaculum arcticum] [Desulfotruncus arcticus DSM 17038]